MNITRRQLIARIMLGLMIFAVLSVLAFTCPMGPIIGYGIALSVAGFVALLGWAVINAV